MVTKVANLQQRRKNVMRCNRVGKCKGWDPKRISPCPITLSSGGFSANSPKGLMITAREILSGQQEYSKTLSDTVFKCTSCGNCTSLCASIDFETGGPLTRPDAVIQAMKADLIEAGMVPQTVKNYLSNVYNFGNAYAAPSEERDEDLRVIKAPVYDGNCEYLLYLGDIGSYDPRGRQAVRALISVLQNADISFGVLGQDEKCDGNDVLYLGERTLFEYLAASNIDVMQEKGVQKVITLSPHAYNAIKNEYPSLGGYFETIHYTQFLADLIAKDKISLYSKLSENVTYHDPCFLGRRNGEYEAPRVVLQAFSGDNFIEMPRNKQNALCCGGGSANAFTDVLGGGMERPAIQRVREAVSVGATVMAIACPQCMIMFEDAVRAADLSDKIRIVDISELLLAAMIPAKQ